MHCDQFQHNLEPYLDGELASQVAADCEQHVRDCPSCERQLVRKRKLRAALGALPVDPPEDGFLDSVIENTLVASHRSERWFWSTASIGGALAAGIIAWLILVLPADLPTAPETAVLETVAISLNTEKTFRVSFDSARELEAATVSLTLPDGVDLVGYEGRSAVSWTTTVAPGTNILALPIVVRSGPGGVIQARLEHDGKAKSFEFAVEVIRDGVENRHSGGPQV